MPLPHLIRCYNKCEKCGIVPYMGYESALGLTEKQTEQFIKKRTTCQKCGGTAKLLTLEEERKYGLDGFPGYTETPPHLLDFLHKKHQG